MDEQPYTSDDQLDRFLTKLSNKVDNGFSGTHQRLDTLNGKVAAHEQFNAEISRWRERMRGVAIASGVFLSVVIVPMLGWGLYVLVEIQAEMNRTPTTREEIIKELIDLEAEAEKLIVASSTNGDQ